MGRFVQPIRTILARFIACDEAATATEYALVLCVLAVVVVTAALSMGQNLSSAVTRVSTDVSDLSPLGGGSGASGPLSYSGPGFSGASSVGH